MGIDAGTARLLIEEAKKRPFHGSVLTFGKQSVNMTLKSLQKIASEKRFELSRDIPISLSTIKDRGKNNNFISQDLKNHI